MDEGCRIPSRAARRRGRSMGEGRRIPSRTAHCRGRAMDKGSPFQWMPSSRSHRRCRAMDRGCDAPSNRGLAQLQMVRAAESERGPTGGDQDLHHVAMLVAAYRHSAHVHAHAEGAPTDMHGSPMRAPRQRA
jgi:hypothetical protein